MKNLTSRLAAAFLVLACSASFSVSALADNDKDDLLMSFNETLDSNTTLDGNVTLTGAISDRGTRHELQCRFRE